MLEKSKKIALVYDAVFPFIKGGAEKRFHEIGKRLAKDGHDVHLYGMKSWDGPNVMNHEGMTLHGICMNHPLYTKSGKRSISQAIIFGFASFKLWREPFDVVDCCGFPYFSLFPLRIITWLRRKKLYSTWHEVWGLDYWKQYLGKFGFLGYYVEKIAVLMPNCIISVSDSTTESITNKLGRKKGIVQIANGLDVDKIINIQPAAESSDVIFVGRLLSHKNVDILIKAIALVRHEFKGISLAILGDGPEKKNLEKLVEKLKLTENVKIFGFVEKDEDVYSHMHASKVFVLPSAREGFGMVVLEANACGLPVITITHPQNTAKSLIIKDENGSLCQLDATSIAQRISFEIKNRKNSSFYQGFIDHYDWKRIVPKLCSVYLL
ncbi:MAG: glycosyltransferase family 4 protein [Candidatus Moraniibacteriota bacterium]